MELSSELLSQFAKVTKPETETPNVGVTVEGTAKLYNGKIYVQLDGSDQLTPVISSTAGMKDGDRVTALIKDHTVRVTGNTSSPSANQGDIDDTKQEIVDQITEVEILVAEKASIKDLEAESARIDDLTADNVTIKDKLTANEADIKNLKAENVEISGDLTAQNAEIENLKATKLDVDIADIKFATIENLETTNANIHNLQADYGEFKQLSTDKFTANDASIKKLEAEKANIKDLDTKYANIDFANIGKAAIENLFSKSGMIGDLVVGDGSITGTLVGVTIKGDLIEGGTVKADKLVVQGSDGLYYKLNVTGEKVSAQQTEYNSLNGSIITAKSITAEKVNVHDLVAFGATIGGFHITDSALYSGVKDSVNNTTRGTYMNDDGEFAIGDSANYLKFYKDTDGTYKLAISAKEIKMSSSNVSIETIVDDVQNDVNNIKSEAIKTTQEQFYPSTSPTELVGGYWSSTQPTWKDGIYLWRRTLVTYISGDTAYTPSIKGVCITGNTGKPGKGTDLISNPMFNTSNSDKLVGAYALDAKDAPVAPPAQFTSYARIASRDIYVTEDASIFKGSTSNRIFRLSAWVCAGDAATKEIGLGFKLKYAGEEYTWNRVRAANPADCRNKWVYITRLIEYSKPIEYAMPWIQVAGFGEDCYGWWITGWSVVDLTEYKNVAKEEIGMVEVGGRNYVRNSLDRTNVTSYGITVEYLDNGFHVYGTPTKLDAAFGLGEWINETKNILKPGEEYTLSATPSLPSGLYLGFNSFNSTGGAAIPAGSNSYLYGPDKSITFTVASNSNGRAYGFFGIKAGQNKAFDVTFKIKLEKGNKATDWTPAPEDIDSQIEETKQELVAQTAASIKQSQDSIISTVSETYSTKGETSEVVKSMDTKLTQTKNEFSFEFSQMNKLYQDLSSTTGKSFEEIHKYIRFVNGDIVLGESSSPVSLKIENDRISFLENNKEVMYITNQQLYIMQAIIAQRLDIGKFAWIPRSNGNVSFRFNG